MFWYLRHQRSKQTNLADLQYILNYPLFFQKLVQKVKKNLEYESILYNSNDWTIRWLDIQRISKSNYIIFDKD